MCYYYKMSGDLKNNNNNENNGNNENNSKKPPEEGKKNVTDDIPESNKNPITTEINSLDKSSGGGASDSGESVSEISESDDNGAENGTENGANNDAEKGANGDANNSASGDANNAVDNSDSNTIENFEIEKNKYKSTKEYNIFKNELNSLIHNNLLVLKECKSNKRLLDIKYSELNRKINYIQISVILFSTMSGFLQSTKTYFNTGDPVVSVTGITISTYISLILSISKYYKFDEKKEAIHNLREKYANLHNKIEYRMDILGPYTNHSLWEHQNVSEKLKKWTEVKNAMEDEYLTLIETKQALTTEFESIMDSKSRNKNYIRDRDLVLNNRKKLLKALEQHNNLEKDIEARNIPTTFESAIQLPDDDLNNWDDQV